MPTIEIEAKFLNINLDDIREKLKSIGATCKVPMRLMRRAVLDYPDMRLREKGNAWVRIRDEGDKINLTFKQSAEHVFGGATEIETTVGSFEQARDLFLAIGLHVKSYQENKRETWEFEGTEIVIDEWPWLAPYIEIEGSSEAVVKQVAQSLGMSWDSAVFGTVIVAYRSQYPKITSDNQINLLPEITFEQTPPDWAN